MNLSIGIVGLPNVGKSTLFNALLKKQASFAEASAGQAGSGFAKVGNYPFTTIEPNVGIVPVPDERLNKLASIIYDLSSINPPIIPATVKFIDIAGLVKGAAEGQGLGNKFLSHIREATIIAHVVRVFTDPNVIRTSSTPVSEAASASAEASAPKSDYEIVRTELELADLDTRGEPLAKKPEIVVLNVSEVEYNSSSIDNIQAQYSALLNIPNDKIIVICAKIESDLSELSENEQKEYLNNLGLQESGLSRLIRKAYETLGLISFLTAGEKEVRAWTVRLGATSLTAAGEIHTDFMKNFIKAEVVPFEEFVQTGGWRSAREQGKTRFEGRDYIMQDGDVVEFKIGS